MASGHVAAALAPVLGDAAVEFCLGLVVVAQAVPEGRVGACIYDFVGAVVGVGPGKQAHELQHLEYPYVGLGPEGVGDVHRRRAVQLQFLEYVEAVQRHHFLHSASVVVAQRKVGVVRRPAAVLIAHLLVRVGEVGIFEGVHVAVGALRTLSREIVAYVQLYPARRSQGEAAVDVVALIAVVYQHAVVVVVAQGYVICRLVAASAEREVVVVGEGVAEKFPIPVGRRGGQLLQIGVLPRLVPAGELSAAGAHLPDYAHDGIYDRIVALRGGVSVSGELVPELLLPGDLLPGIHQLEIPLRTE